jgi:acetyltransferase-like isoleucine patch superfamily enzyme
MKGGRTLPWDWHPGVVPENVVLDETAYLETTYSFLLFRSQRERAVEIGRGASVYLGVMFDLGPRARVTLGDYVLMNGARIICDAEIQIGPYSLISWNVVLMDSYRVAIDPQARRNWLERVAGGSDRPEPMEVAALPIRIGSNVWIGFDCCVLPGVRIGDNAVVGARSLVTQDVPPNTLVAGNPARVVRPLPPAERPPPAPGAPSSSFV